MDLKKNKTLFFLSKGLRAHDTPHISSLKDKIIHVTLEDHTCAPDGIPSSKNVCHPGPVCVTLFGSRLFADAKTRSHWVRVGSHPDKKREIGHGDTDTPGECNVKTPKV